MSGSSDDGPDKNEFDVVRDRATPPFHIVDADGNVVLQPAAPGDAPLPEPARAAVRHMVAALRSGDGRTMAVDVISATELLRVMTLDGEQGAAYYAVFLERFAPRASLDEAAKRFGLTAREAQVLQGLMRGLSTGAIAQELHIAPTTVQEHIRKIGQKTNVTKRSMIVAKVFNLT